MDAMIEGVLFTPLRRIPNPKGDIQHAMKSSSPGFAGFGEAYFSSVFPGQIKGWKRHRSATLNLVVPLGDVRFVVHDDRQGSKTKGLFQEVMVGSANYVRLTVQPGLWVAFQGISTTGNILLNISNEEHDPVEADNRDLDTFFYPW
jgi:dTDP-4-dehydrorhamnose 3,5-epimerase